MNDPDAGRGAAAPDGRLWREVALATGRAQPRGGAFARIGYAASLLDPLARPILETRDAVGQVVEMPLPAPVFGRAEWIGRLPEGFVRARIWAGQAEASPHISGEEPSGAATRFEAGPLRRCGLPRAWAAAAIRRPGLALLALRAAMSGDRKRALSRLQAALDAWPLRLYPLWRRARRRRPDWTGLDAPPGQGAPRLRLLLAQGAHAAQETAPAWARFDVRPAPAGASLPDLLEGWGDDDLAMWLGPGGRLREGAGPALVGAAARGAADVFYGDEERGGVFAQPRFKPDYGPIAAQGLDLFGGAWAARVGRLRAQGPQRVPQTGIAPPTAGARVAHVRRVLTARGDAGARAASLSPPPPAAPMAVGPLAALVIPTRDRADLLGACLRSLERVAAGAAVEIVLVDNGSSAPDALALLADAERRPDVQVARAPGPFNFSALSNLGARLTRAPVLIFLNNDVEAVTADWARALAGWACAPAIGAVGAKLLYEDGRLQHAGVTLGLGGRAAHFERRAPADAPGYFDRLDVAHEVSAVTGAVLAVERAKFDAVNGFDAVNLPIDLNDVDLCLRLRERGWTSLMEPRVRLLHKESASRGVGEPGEGRYAAEADYFTRRWAGALHDDPFFHPALSLRSYVAALG